MQKKIKSIQDVLAKAHVKEFEITVEKTAGVTLEVKNQKVDAFETSSTLGFALRLKKGDAVGFAFGRDFSSAAIRASVDAALVACESASPQPGFTFATQATKYPATQSYDEKLIHRTRDEKLALALQLEKAAMDASPKIKRARYTTYGDQITQTHLINSTGLELSSLTSDTSLSLTAVAEEGASSEMSEDFASSAYFDRLNPVALGKSVAEEAVALLGGERQPNFKGPCVLKPSVVIEMLEVLAPSVLFENIHKKNSFLIGKMGASLYSPAVTLLDDALHPLGDPSGAFDAEGTPHQKIAIIEKGVLKRFLTDRLWALEEGGQSTGNFVREEIIRKPRLDGTNFFIEPGTATQAQLWSQMGNGYYVTEVIGMHTADPISGDFSVGTQGFVIQNGKVARPFRSMAMTGNLHTLFSSIISVGSDLKFYGKLGSSSLLVGEASFSGSDDEREEN